VALARALGLPARENAGLVYVDRSFYYHAWPEVYVGEWITLDPVFNQLPADATHIRFVTGGVDRQVELLRVMGKLKSLKVLAAK
jgi:transglutaminase-like putative cysteine protease